MQEFCSKKSHQQVIQALAKRSNSVCQALEICLSSKILSVRHTFDILHEMVTRHTLECPVKKNHEVAASCDQNAATEIQRQSTCVIRRMGPRKFPGEGTKTMQFVASPIQKTGCTLRHYWRQAKACREKFNLGNRVTEHFVRKYIPGYTSDSVFLVTTTIFFTCSVAISSKTLCVQPRLLTVWPHYNTLVVNIFFLTRPEGRCGPAQWQIMPNNISAHLIPSKRNSSVALILETCIEYGVIFQTV